MATGKDLRETILAALRARAGCELEELVQSCQGFTWAEIFLEVDRLSRSGNITLTRHNHSGYWLAMPPTEPSTPVSSRIPPSTR